jgi:hypothetical protein
VAAYLLLVYQLLINCPSTVAPWTACWHHVAGRDRTSVNPS